MNKGVIKAGILAAVFVTAVLVFSVVTNKTNKDMTTEMKEAELPTISLYYKEEKINELYGYADKMNAVYMREDITPIHTDRILPISIHTGKYNVDSISYEIRSMDTSRLIANAQVDNYKQTDGVISAELQIQNILDDNQEYLLLIKLGNGEKSIYYYTRIIEPADSHVKESIEFTKDFHAKTFDKEQASSLATYMEPDAAADNTTLGKVSIQSSLKQVAWADFEGTVLHEPYICLKEIQPTYNVVMLQYVVSSAGESGELEYYNVEEYYRVRYTNDRIYLLNFERTMNQIFRAENDNFEANNLRLGICSGNIEYKANEPGNIICFVREGELWSYNAAEEKLSQVFSFRGYEGIEDRENRAEHDIRIIKVDETGSADFVVYGYMNRGVHEGQTGICVYHYDSVANTVEEELFIPSTHSYEVLQSEIGKLMYENENGEFFIMYGGTLYQIDLSAAEEKKLESGFDSEDYAVSDSNQYIAYIEGGDSNAGTAIKLMNLEDSSDFEVKASAGTYIRPLGFMGDDFIYGEAKTEDVYTDRAGNTQFPMNHIYIVDTKEEDHPVLKDYYKEGYYISSIEVKDYTIFLNREEYNGMTYVPTSQDTIMNREGDTAAAISLASYTDEKKETQMQIVLNGLEELTSKRLLTPKQIVLEQDRTISLIEPEEEEYYYAYAKGRVVLGTDSATAAIRAANDNMGIVIGSKQQYIWKRARKMVQQSIPITVGTADVNGDSITKAVSGMLETEDMNVGVGAMLESGSTPKQILKDTMQDAEILDLTGIRLEEVLYYVNLGTPVFAMQSDTSAVLVTGYDSANVTLYDPSAGKAVQRSIKDAQELFDEAGNVYFAYLK